MRERPDDRHVMVHSWRELAFLHWQVPQDDLQKLLPPGLWVDTFEDRAYVGLVPFTMSNIRLARAPRLPGLHASHETNVRTYVVDERGRPGVWFFSLDAANGAFVQVARAWYRLPYFRADMAVEYDQTGAKYTSVRRGVDKPFSRIEIAKSGEAVPSPPGSLEFFLVERYLLFAYSRGRLLAGRVFHSPYPLRRAQARSVEENLVKAAQIKRRDEEPLVHFSPGVDVDVYQLR
jgi:uncharacterized protein YqjF (DUF2071 family)